MRIVKKSNNQANEHYKEITEFEISNKLKDGIEEGLSSIFLISQNIPIRDPIDFLSGYNFSISESFEELETSYELVKFGFYKQSMISLRVALDIGLLSIYWEVIGKENKDFKRWLNSKKDTPFKNKSFWNTIESNHSIKAFNDKFNLFQKIKDNDLSDFVHTKGV